MNIELLPFQRFAIADLQNAVESGHKEIILKSCTGSGKTIILTHFMDEYLKCHNNTVFMWFTPGKGNLEEQSKKKMDLYIHNAQTKLLSDIMTSGFSDGDCCFINWELLNKDKNNARKEGEHTNFDEHVKKALDSGLEFKLIIDESHVADTVKTKGIVDIFNTNTIIRASATPKGYDKSAKLIDINESDVINQGLIKKLLVINEGFGQIEGKTLEDNQVDFLLSKALEKQRLLRSKFLNRGTNINPLILVQMPNTSDALLESVERWFESQKISYENGQLAIWMSEKGKKTGGITMHENLDGIEKNDAIPVAMIFKMAVATGWDCPRAHILVKLRDNMGEAFEIQTFGRIRRMPEAKHYNDDDLDSCYLYTLDDKFIEGAKQQIGKGALDASLINLKPEYKEIELISEQRPDIEEPNDSKKAVVSITEHFRTKYNLSDDAVENQKKMETDGYVFSNYITNSTKYGNIHLTSQVDQLKEVDFKTPLNTHTHGREYHHQVGRISTDVSLEYDKVNAIVRRLFCEPSYKKTGRNKIKKLLKLDTRPLYAFVINNIDLLREDFKEAMTEQTAQGTLGINSGTVVKKAFRFPQQCLFTYNSKEMSQKIFSKNVYANYLESAEIRSSGEKAFERFCERNDFVQWFYKNGDKGTDYYSVLYEDNNGKQRAFYPDYVVGTTEGIWIIETKGGEDKSGNSQDIDKFSPKKFKALKKYIQIQQNDGKQIFGGFVRRDGSENLCICTDNYSEQIVTPNWKLLEEVFK